MSDIVSKNLLVYPYYRLNSIDNGVSMVVNNDGSITLNGTTSDVESQNKFYDLNTDSKLELPVGEYIFSIDGLPVIDMYSQFMVREVVSPYTAIIAVNNTAPFTITQEIADKLKTGDYNVQIKLCVRTNRTIDNVTVYPMIRLASDPDDTWEPYHPPIHVPDVYFRCTSTAGGAKLEVSYGDEFVGKVLTATNGNKTIRRMAGTSGTVTFTVPESGLWTVSGEVGGATYSVQESVVLDYSVALVSGFDYKSWLTAGGVDPTSYSSLADVLADEILVRRLMTIHAAVDYLASFQTVNADLETVINNDICAKWINLRDYALDTLYANSAIAAVMDTADKYGYGEWCLMPQVPTMTSNTAPYGTAFASTQYDANYAAWKAFSTAGQNTYWSTSQNAITNQYIGYHFISPVCVKKVVLTNSISNDCPKNCVIQYSNDGTNYTDAKTFVNKKETHVTVDLKDNNIYATYWRLVCLDNYGSSYIYLFDLQFYAYAPKGCVPIMTSNTAPYGEASAYRYGTQYGNRFPWHAFDGDNSTDYSNSTNANTSDYLQYKFTNPTCVKKVTMCISNNAIFDIEGSNDNVIFTPLKQNIQTGSDSYTNPITVDLSDNDDYYLIYRIHNKHTGGSEWWFSINNLQFYGRQLSVSVPVMTSNTAPYGVVSSDGYDTAANTYPYHAFSNENKGWGASASSGTHWLMYDFGKIGIIPKRVTAKHLRASGTMSLNTSVIIRASNDNNQFTEIGRLTIASSGIEYVSDNIISSACRYIKVEVTGTYLQAGEGMKFQFYGLDYSEREFEPGTTKKWLYDHGVEVAAINVSASGTGAVATKNSDYVEISTTSATGSIATMYKQENLSDYNTARCKFGDTFNPTSGYIVLAIYSQVPNASGNGEESILNMSSAYANLPYAVGLDISSFTGNHYVSIHARNSSTGYVKDAKITELWVE